MRSLLLGGNTSKNDSTLDNSSESKHLSISREITLVLNARTVLNSECKVFKGNGRSRKSRQPRTTEVSSDGRKKQETATYKEQ